MKVLIVDDEVKLADALGELFRHNKFIADVVYDGEDGYFYAKKGDYDVVVLDVMLPKMDGFEVVQRLRRNKINVPVLMLTAKDEVDDRVKGLDCGADDYLTKPFLVEEMLARLRALSRRGAIPISDSPSFGDIELDSGTMMLRCTATDESVKLSDKEFRALEYLMLNKGQVLSKDRLAAKIWGFDNDAEYNNVEVYMSFVRKKLAFVGSKTSIKAVRGVGYELRYSE